MEPQAKTVTINAAAGGTFYGNSGARYSFPPNAFRTATGQLVTGNVTIQATEYVAQSDMIFSGILPISSGRSLVSGGETFVKVTQGGQELYIAEGKSYQVNIPQHGPVDSSLSLFLSNGNFAAEDSGRLNNWQPFEDSTGGTENIGFTMVIGDSISLNLDSVGWANADAFMTIPNNISFTITLSAGGLTIPNDVKAYALFDAYKGVWPLGLIGSISNGIITEQHTPATPCLFVVATTINGDLYGGSLAATPLSGSNYNISLSKMTAAQFKAIVDAH
jgi:hypothetical protein